jgi:hypothetical protein
MKGPQPMSATAELKRNPRYAPAGHTTEAASLCIGDRLWLDDKRQSWTVQARGDRYIVLTKPFNLQHTTIYTVIDLELGIRGRDNWYGLGYETRKECEDALARFEAPGEDHDSAEISTRSNVTLDITRVSSARPS